MGVSRGALRHVFIVGAYAGVIGFILRWTGPLFHVPAGAQLAINRGYYLALAVALAAKLGWAQAAWKALPDGCRVTALGKWIHPDEAAWGHLIPWRFLTWQFTVHVGVAEATNSVLAAYDTRVQTSVRLPFVACALLLVPGVNFLLFPAFLYSHMESVDRAQNVMARCLAEERAVRPWVPPQRPTNLSLVKPLVFAALLCWIGIPFVLVELATSGRGRSSSSSSDGFDAAAYGAVKTPELVETNADRIAEAMVACGEATGRKLPKKIDDCPAAQEATRRALAMGGASYLWEGHGGSLGVLVVWRLDAHRVYAKRHVSCFAREGCSYQREKYGL